MFGRRVPPKTIFFISLALAVVFAFWASHSWQNEHWLALGISGILAVWLGVDAFRAYGWWQAAEKEAAAAAEAAEKEAAERAKR